MQAQSQSIPGSTSPTAFSLTSTHMVGYANCPNQASVNNSLLHLAVWGVGVVEEGSEVCYSDVCIRTLARLCVSRCGAGSAPVAIRGMKRTRWNGFT